jgi:aspartate aminotransferase
MTVTTEQVAEMGEYAHIYMTKDGRISMAGLNEHNIQVSSQFLEHRNRTDMQYFAESMSKCAKGELKNKSSL